MLGDKQDQAEPVTVGSYMQDFTILKSKKDEDCKRINEECSVATGMYEQSNKSR